MTEIAQKPKQYNLALISVFFGFFLFSLPAVICGHVALSKIKHSDKYTNTDKRMAIGGLILGYSGIFVWLYLWLLICALIFNWDLSFIFPYGIPT